MGATETMVNLKKTQKYEQCMDLMTEDLALQSNAKSQLVSVKLSTSTENEENVCQRFVSVLRIIVDRMDLWVLADNINGKTNFCFDSISFPVYSVFAYLDSSLTIT